MNVDVTHWKEFKVSELFDVRGTITTPIEMLEKGTKKHPYVTTQSSNNGVRDFFSSYTENGNVITIDSAVVGFASYQEENFSASDHVEKLIPKFTMTRNIALFIVTILNQEQYRYSYGRKDNQKNINNTVLRLPVDIFGNPNWDYMENYINSLHNKPLTTKNKKRINQGLNLENWKEFKLGELFVETYKAKAHAKQNMMICEANNKNAIPFITRTEENNACDCFVYNYDLEGIEEGNAIVIGDTTATISYQANRFVTGDHIVVCRAEWINKYTALFVKSVLEKERYRYSYGRAFKKDLILSTTVKLPAIKTKEETYIPNYDYMEVYIKSLPYGDRI